MLDKFKEALARLQSEALSEDQVVKAISRIVNCRLLWLVVQVTGTKIDDTVLDTLRELFPKN